jgi:hypothetical protein
MLAVGMMTKPTLARVWALANMAARAIARGGLSKIMVS